jgi:glycosyltransferase involved in cell wall biosynthesis
MKKLIVILPALNEAEVLGGVLAKLKLALKKIKLAAEIAVIDDGSSDSTGKIAAESKVTVLTHIINRGLGAALGTGLAYAKRKRADYAVTFDSDGQHDDQDIARVLEPLIAGRADVVIGSRLLSPTIKQMPVLRRFNNRAFNLLTWFFFGKLTTDSLSGFKGFNRLAIATINLKTERMEASNEFFAEIKRHHLRLEEVPIRVIYTAYSIKKGVKPGNIFAIIFRLVLRLLR